jgi:DNA-binding beta-propeller fold protein YncE
MKKVFYSFFILSLLMLPFSCMKDKGYVISGNYPADIDRIISTRCAVSGCHNTASKEAASGLDLSSWDKLFQGSRSGSPVIAFNSRFSSLCYFINTYADLGAINAPTMPVGAAALSREEVLRVKQWINEGAPSAEGEIPFGGAGIKKLYAVNQGCDVVTVFDSETHLPIRYIEVGNGKSTPHQVRVSPDGKYWYVVFLNSNVMKKYRCSDDGFVADIPLTPLAAKTGPQNALDWNTFVISPDSKRAYCVSWTALGVVATVDLVGHQLIHFSGGWNYPHGICLSKDGSKVYIAAQTGNYVSEIDTSFEVSTLNEYALDGGQVSSVSSLDPHDLVLNEEGTLLVLTCQTSNEVIVFDLLTRTPMARIKTPYYPQEIIYSKKYKAYYVTCSGNGTPADPGSVMKISANLTTESVKHGAQPHGLAVDERSGLLYVLSRNISAAGPIPHHTSQCEGKNGFVSFLNPENLKTTGDKFELSVDPYFIYPQP